MPVFAGVDWGGARHRLGVVDDKGGVVANERFSHDRPGVDAMVGALERRRRGDAGGHLRASRGDRRRDTPRRRLPRVPRQPEGRGLKHASATGPRTAPATASTPSWPQTHFVWSTTARARWRWRQRRWPSPASSSGTAGGRSRHNRPSRRELPRHPRGLPPRAIPPPPRASRGLSRWLLRDPPAPEAASPIGEARMRGFLRHHGYTGRPPAAVASSGAAPTCWPRP